MLRTIAVVIDITRQENVTLNCTFDHAIKPHRLGWLRSLDIKTFAGVLPWVMTCSMLQRTWMQYFKKV